MPETITRPTSAQLRDACLEHGDKIREVRERPADKRDDKFAAELRQVSEELYALDRQFTSTWQAEKFELELAAWQDAQTRAAERAAKGGGPDAATSDVGQAEARSWGAQFIASESYAERRDAKTESVEVRTLLSTGSGSGNLFTPVGSPFLGNVRQQRLFLRDVLPVSQTNLASIPYIRETTPLTYEVGASSVSEGGLKPEVTMAFTSVDAPVRKIAAWLPVTNEIIEDGPTLMGYIDGRLGYMVAVREEQQLLNGSGASPQLTGLYNAGIATSSTGADKMARIGVGIGAVENVDGYPNAVAINPTEYWSIMTTRSATQFDGGFSTGAPFGSTPTTLWGLPAVRTRAIAMNKALVGDYAQGAQIFQREGVQVRTTDSHDDYFVYNKMVVLAEERIAFAIYRPDFFVDVTLS